MAGPRFPPPGACDCHVHVVGPKWLYPLQSQRSYTPMDAPLEALRAMLGRLGLDRVVLVQPSFYGTDNSCLLAALAALGDAARAVAVVAPDVPGSVLDDLDRRGVRGLRVNIASWGDASSEAIRARLEQASALGARNGWHVQAFLPADAIVELADVLAGLGTPVVIDHFGLIAPEAIEGEPARCLARLLATGRVWVKLSAPYRIAREIADPRVAKLARRLADINPERVLWASDWPHTPVHRGAQNHDDREIPYRDVDTAGLLHLVQEWFPEPRRRDQILVRNPARLYGFV